MRNDDRTGPGVSADLDPAIPLEVIPLHSTNLLTVLDERGVIQYESPAIEYLYGFDQDALTGDQVADYFHPEDRDRVLAAFQAVVSSEGDTTEAVEYRHRQSDGTYKWVESVASANPTPEGYYVVNTRDTSERKEREMELQRTNDRLEAFADVLTHDLRNPLEIATAGLELVRQDCESDHLTTVADAHDRMATLIEDLLTIAREGSGALELTTVKLAETVHRCWETVETRDASLDMRTDRTVRADEGQLRQLFENLVRNAVEHGGSDVTVTVGALDDEEGFYVEDDGAGIPVAERDRVFEPGYSSAAGDLGVGLAIVQSVCEAHDWGVTVTEGRDGGARFEVTTGGTVR